MTCKQDLYFDTCAGVFFLWVRLSWVQVCFCKSPDVFPAWRSQSIYCGWLCAPLAVFAVPTLLFMSGLLLFLFLLLFNPASFPALTRSAFPLIPAEFAFLISALVRFLAFLSVSSLGWEQEKSIQAYKKQNKWLLFTQICCFPPSVIL